MCFWLNVRRHELRTFVSEMDFASFTSRKDAFISLPHPFIDAKEARVFEMKFHSYTAFDSSREGEEKYWSFSPVSHRIEIDFDFGIFITLISCSNDHKISHHVHLMPHIFSCFTSFFFAARSLNNKFHVLWQ